MLTPVRCRRLALIVLAFAATAAVDGLALLLPLGLGLVLLALTAEWSRPAAPPRYCLEHRRPGHVHVLAVTHDEAAGRAALQDHAATLSAASVPGQLVLVDVTSGAAITWRVLEPRPRAA
jgi:hypothetical protein